MYIQCDQPCLLSPQPAQQLTSELKDLRRRVKAAGSLEAFTDLLLSEADDSEFECVHGGESMTGASKHRMMTEPPMREDRELAMSGKDGDKKLSESPASFGLKIPKGIVNIDQWGQTVLATGKHHKAGFSYHELFFSSKQEH